MESRKMVLMNLVENWLNTVGEGESEMSWASTTNTHTLACVKQTVSGKLLSNTGSPAWCFVMAERGEMGGGEEGSVQRDVDKITTEERCCMAETETTLYSNFHQSKKNL